MKGTVTPNDKNMFAVPYILICIMIVALIFYGCFINFSYRNIKKHLIKKGRLLHGIPLVAISTITQVGGVTYIPPVNSQQPSAPSNIYTAPDGSRIFDSKVAPPVYTP